MEIKLLQKERNYGFALLKMFMSFEVILCHCWVINDNLPFYLKIFARFKGEAVPVFMFLSFYLLETTFLNCETTKIKKRLFKVAYPQFGWAVIYWCAYASLKILFNKFQTLKISDLFLQIIFGHTVNSSMWFQFVLIVLTIIFFLIFKLGSEKKGILTLHILLLISFAIEYSGLNYFLFSNLPNSVKYPLEGFFPMIPYAILGFDFAYFKIFEKLKENRIFWIIFLFFCSILVLQVTIINGASGFYSCNNSILVTVFISGFCYLLPFEKLNEGYLSFIEFASRYTLGIYCMHRLVGKFVNLFFEKMNFEDSSFISCVLIYILCFAISLIISKIPSKYIKTLVE